MSATITIHNDHQMNTSISRALPMPTIIIQFPLYLQSNNGFHVPCEYCGRTSSQTDEKKEVKNDQHINNVKDEIKDIKPNDNYIKEEECYVSFDIDERLPNNDPNIYNNLFSPISINDSVDSERTQVYVPEHYDDGYNVTIKENFQNISEIVEYLKQDITMN